MQPCTEPVNGTVLFVEDDAAMLSLAQLILESLGYGVLLAATGGDAIELYRHGHGTIDFAVVDLVLPDIPGTDVIRELNEIDEQVAILIATGLALEEAKKALEAGADGIISKPYGIGQLAEELACFPTGRRDSGEDAGHLAAGTG
jgi:two-component system alkaline phosphatase synthesis response regulator PhoP